MFSTMAGSVEDQLTHMAATYRTGDAVDLHTELMRVTLDIVSRCMFSTDITDGLDKLGPDAVDIAINFAFSGCRTRSARRRTGRPRATGASVRS